jgi:hypothetical protein
LHKQTQVVITVEAAARNILLLRAQSHVPEDQRFIRCQHETSAETERFIQAGIFPVGDSSTSEPSVETMRELLRI